MKYKIDRIIALEAAQKLANDSSDKNRNFYIAYLALSFYVLIMAAGIEDKDLLLNQHELSIPLLSLGLKPSIWFIIAPITLFLVYLDLILNLNEHLRKLLAWRDTNGSWLSPKTMQPFLVNFAFAHQRYGFWGWLYYFMLWLSVIMFAPITFVVCLVKFGHYQSIGITILYMVLLWLSLGLAWYFLIRWRIKTDNTNIYDTQLICKNIDIRWLREKLNSLKSYMNLHVLVTILIVICSLQYCILFYGFANGEPPEWFQTNIPIFYDNWKRLDIIMTAHNGKYVMRVKDNTKSYFKLEQLPWLLPCLQVTETVLISFDQDEKKSLELLSNTIKLADQNEKAVAKSWWTYGKRLDLSNRNFNYAELHGSDLSRADLSDVKLANAN